MDQTETQPIRAKKESTAHLIIVIFLLGLMPWASTSFFDPELFFDIGDAGFSFDPNTSLIQYFYSWVEVSNEGLGATTQLKSLGNLIFYLVVWIFHTIEIPLWITNRLFFLIPTWLTLYIIYWFIGYKLEGPSKKAIAVLAAFYCLTAPPQAHLDPKISLAFCGYILSFGAFQRYLDEQKFKYIFLFSVGVIFIFNMPRYIYLFIITLGAYAVAWYIFSKMGRLKVHWNKIFKGVILVCLLSLLVNAYSVLPLFHFLASHESTDLMPTEQNLQDRITTYLNIFSGTTGPLYSLRLVYNKPDSVYASYFFHGPIEPLTFLIPGLAVFGVFLAFKKQSSPGRNIQSISIVFIFFIWLLAIYGSDFYRYMMKIIPGFWILNTPNYMLSVVSILLSSLLAFSTTEILNFTAIKNTQKNLAGVFLLSLIIICNGYYIFDWIPTYRNMYGDETRHNHALGNRTAYFKVPQDYQKAQKLFTPQGNQKFFVIPSIPGYTRFQWSPNVTMPDILMKLGPLRPGGITITSEEDIYNIPQYILKNQPSEAHLLLKKLRYKHLFLHKDLIPTISPQYETALKNSEKFTLIENNSSFNIYKIK